ncbi:MAG: response regulator [Bacteroidota bacterium]
MSEVKLLWIDDDPERESTAKKLEEKLNSGIEFLCVNGKDVEETISKNKQRFSELDLVIMDHRLDTARSNSIKTGATASSLLREGEGYESLPILCVTSEPDLVDNQQRLAYQGVIDFGEIISKTYVAEIKSIINGFKDLKDKPINSIDSIFDKLRSSYEAKENLIKVLPKELKTNFEEPTYSLSFHRWLKRTLIGRPGFLYDRLWVSTYLGLNETGFSKVEHLFTESLYSGIFC